MELIIVGLAVYLLYRYYAQPPQGSQPVVVNLDSEGGGGGDTPAAPVDNGGGGSTPPPVPPAAPSGPTASWQPIPEGAQLQPGFTYRASAPPQGFLVMSLISGRLSSMGFTDVQIYKPGDAFPNDWPDSGNALRIQATLPAGASPQTFNLDGVTVWQQVVTQTAGQVAEQVVRHVARGVYETMNRVRGAPYPKVAIPASNGVYDGLVRHPQSR
jgi:hypothetical protein